jgi:hypothetical protein
MHSTHRNIDRRHLEPSARGGVRNLLEQETPASFGLLRGRPPLLPSCWQPPPAFSWRPPAAAPPPAFSWPPPPPASPRPPGTNRLLLSERACDGMEHSSALSSTRACCRVPQEHSKGYTSTPTCGALRGTEGQPRTDIGAHRRQGTLTRRRRSTGEASRCFALTSATSTAPAALRWIVASCTHRFSVMRRETL